MIKDLFLDTQPVVAFSYHPEEGLPPVIDVSVMVVPEEGILSSLRLRPESPSTPTVTLLERALGSIVAHNEDENRQPLRRRPEPFDPDRVIHIDFDDSNGADSFSPAEADVSGEVVATNMDTAATMSTPVSGPIEVGSGEHGSEGTGAGASEG